MKMLLFIYTVKDFPGVASVKEPDPVGDAGCLGSEDPLQEGIATHSSIAWRTTGTEEPDGVQSMGPQSVRHDLATEQQQLNNGVLHIHS